VGRFPAALADGLSVFAKLKRIEPLRLSKADQTCSQRFTSRGAKLLRQKLSPWAKALTSSALLA
jgi:hypothetical protein